MDREGQAALALTRAVRALFQAMRQLSDEMLADLGVTAAQRAVLEALTQEGMATVPDIARAKRVTRQHIQTSVDALRRAGLVERIENPASRRSPLIGLTDRGRETFDTIRSREAAVLRDVSADMDLHRVEDATALLSEFTERL